MKIGVYRGAVWRSSNGYLEMTVNGERKQVHIHAAEKAFGGKLPKGAEVHHVDGCRTNNDNSNLVICPSRRYHELLHLRTKALDECGNANFRKCRFCNTYDDPKTMKAYRAGLGLLVCHGSCYNEHQRKRYLSKRK
jgi:hypothetical protein